jgi:hypothetical protein
MPENIGFVAAAYAAVLGCFGAYALWIRSRLARIRSELRNTHSETPTAGLPRGRATH